MAIRTMASTPTTTETMLCDCEVLRELCVCIGGRDWAQVARGNRGLGASVLAFRIVIGGLDPRVPSELEKNS